MTSYTVANFIESLELEGFFILNFETKNLKLNGKKRRITPLG